MFTRRVFAAGAMSLVAGTTAWGAPTRFRWPEGKRGAVSLTYDDGLDSQIARAAPDLDAAGFKATFFLTRDNVRANVAQWQDVCIHPLSTAAQVSGL